MDTNGLNLKYVEFLIIWEILMCINVWLLLEGAR